MSALLISILMATGFFILFLVFGFYSFKYRTPQYRSVWIIKTGIKFLPVVLGASILCFSNFRFEQSEMQNPLLVIFIAVICFTILFFITLAFYAAVEHSVRIRILVELAIKNQIQPNTEMKLSELFAVYSPEGALLHRFEQMKKGGYIVEERGSGSNKSKFVLTPKGQAFASKGHFVKRYFNL